MANFTHARVKVKFILVQLIGYLCQVISAFVNDTLNDFVPFRNQRVPLCLIRLCGDDRCCLRAHRFNTRIVITNDGIPIGLELHLIRLPIPVNLTFRFVRLNHQIDLEFKRL